MIVENNNRITIVECPYCGKIIKRSFMGRDTMKVYCSNQCREEEIKRKEKSEILQAIHVERSKNRRPNGCNEIINGGGYKMIRREDHPLKQKNGFVFEHRLVAEEHLLTEENSVEINGKRYLSKEYVVHHKNFNKQDNRPENLQVMKHLDHLQMHNQMRKKAY